MICPEMVDVQFEKQSLGPSTVAGQHPSSHRCLSVPFRLSETRDQGTTSSELENRVPHAGRQIQQASTTSSELENRVPHARGPSDPTGQHVPDLLGSSPPASAVCLCLR